MKILSLDTSSFPASVAVLEDNVILGEYVVRNQRKHSQHIMVMTERLLEDLGIDIADIDVFAVTVGPGSFTGLRIGISTVRAFAQATNRRVAAINTLEALAYNLSCSEGVIIPMLDARRDEVFTAAYKFAVDGISTVIEPCVMTVSEIAERFKDEKCIYLGDGAIIHRDEIKETDENAVFAPVNLSEVRASALASAAAEKINKGEAIHYNEVQPVYLRLSQAEREYKEKKNERKE